MMTKGRVITRTHRLPPETYIGRKSIAFTSCIEGRQPILNDPEIVANFIPLLARAADRFACAVPIYTFMPDHLHVLLIGTSEQSQIKSAMDTFKTLSGRWIYHHRSHARWQRGYWDHIVRDFEGWRSQAKYIAANPCRAGLCQDVFEWPFTGSIGSDIRDVLSDVFF